MLHASAVALGRRGLLILGRSGSGKSSLALELMALGACLVADDRTVVRAVGGHVVASCPPSIRGRIEARGVGILAAEAASEVPLVLAVDMDRAETERLPPNRSLEILGVRLPLLHKSDSRHFPAALLQYLRAGRQ